jgi:hypothetical protein
MKNSNHCRHLVLSVSLLISNIVLCETTTLAQGNLLSDGGFEHGGAGWQFLRTSADATGQIDGTTQHEGKYSYKITNKSGYAPNVYARITQTVSGLRPFTVYKASCWAKGKGCGINWIGGGPGWYNRTAFPQGDFDWREVSFEVAEGAEPDNYDLMVLSESTTEALWVDDVRFEPLKVDDAKQKAVYEEIDHRCGGLEKRLEEIQNRANGKPQAASSPYVKLGIAVAKRFIGFAKSAGPGGGMSIAWTKFQLDEAAQVLDETEKLTRAGSILLTWRQPKPGTVTLKNGVFYEGRTFLSWGRRWFRMGRRDRVR